MKRIVNETYVVDMFNRGIKASELNVFSKQLKGNIIVREELILDTDLSIECDSLILKKGFEIRELININIKGNLEVDGDIFCNNFKIMGDLYCQGAMVSDDIYVSGNLVVIGDMTCYNMRVFGDMSGEGWINSYGDVAIYGNINRTGGVNLCGNNIYFKKMKTSKFRIKNAGEVLVY